MFSLNWTSRKWLILALVIAGFGTLAKGQTISGTIVGTVLDQQGGILAGVGVTASNAETALTYQGVTDTARGMYVIPEVPPGIYHVRAQFSGFQTMEHFPVRVDVNRVTEEDFSLKIFTSTTVVVVTSDAPMTEINTSTQGQYFNQTEIRELPILSRDINNLALLAPGVLSVRTFSFASTLVPFSSSGSWGRYNNFIVDSASNNEPIFGGAATQFSNPDIFSNYAILTSAPKAEFGRNSGSTVNVITKSGSSKLHGTLFYFGQSDKLDAMTRAETAALLTSTPPSFEHKVGGTLGGPLGKKDTFLFLSYQYDRSRADLSNVFPVIGTVPSVQGLTNLQGLSSQASVATMLSYPSIYGTAAMGGQCFAAAPPAAPGFPSPATMNPCFTGNPSTGLATIQYGSYDIPQGNLFDVYDHQASARVDHRLNDSNDFYVRYLVDDLNTPQALMNPAGEVALDDLGRLPDSRSVLLQRTQSGMFDERFARSNSLNEVRFSYTRIAQGIGSFDLPASLQTLPATTVADAYGGFGAFQNNFLSAGNQFTLGQDTSTDTAHSNLYEVQENFSLTQGRHSVKMGGDFVRTQSNIINVPSDLGHYFFGVSGGNNTGNPAYGLLSGLNSFINEPTNGQTNALALIQGMPDLITGPSGVIGGQGANEVALRESDWALFIQDDFRIRSNFNVSAGLRFERFGQPINGILKMNPNAGPILPTSAGDYGPRFGLAWSPGADRKTVIRAGYSLMFNQMPLNIPLLMWQSYPISPQVATLTASGGQMAGLPAGGVFLQTGDYPAAPLAPNSPQTWQSLNNVQVAGCYSVAAPGALPPVLTPGAVPLINCSAQNTVDPNLVNPYAQNWSAGVQRELTRGLMLEVNYVGTSGTKLYQRLDQNPFGGWDTDCTNHPTTCLANAAFLYQALNPRLNPNRGDITSVTNAGRSTYHALQAALNSRTLHLQGTTLTFTAAYTYSHMIDTDSEIFGPEARRQATGNVLTNFLLNPYGIGNFEAITPFAQIYDQYGKAERGNSSYDRRHRFVFSEIWGLPTPTSSGAAKAVLGGWYLNGIGTMQSGQPFSPLNGVLNGSCMDAQGGGILTNTRPDIGSPNAPTNSVALLADPTCRSTSMGYVDLNGSYLNSPYSTAHFVQVPLGTNQGGTAGRNILTGPGIINFDFAMFKQFHWGESKVLEFRWEVYNVLNHPNPAYPLGNVFASNAQQTPGYAFAASASAAGVTGVIPENAVDTKTAYGQHDFLSKGNMNTGNRTMQFGVHFTF